MVELSIYLIGCGEVGIWSEKGAAAFWKAFDVHTLGGVGPNYGIDKRTTQTGDIFDDISNN